MGKYKVICCDVDGTLLKNDKSLSPENIKWIKRVTEAGIHFIIVSGRMLSGIRRFYDQIGIKGPASGYNGCTFYDENDNVVVDHRVEKSSALAILDIIEEQGLSDNAILFDNTDWIVQTKVSYTYSKKIPIYVKECKVRPLRQQLMETDSNKIMVMSPSRQVLDNFLSETKKRLGDSVGYYPGPDFVEIIAGGFSKATAIHDIAAYYSISEDEIVSIGDDYNDIEMLKASGLGVAMGNSVKDVLDIGDLIVPSNEEDGVACMIRKVFFNE